MPKRAPTKSGASLPSEFRKPIYVAVTTGIGLWQTKPLKNTEIIRQLSKLTNQRLEALIKHYKISPRSPDKWKLLSFHLARQLGLVNFAFEEPSSREKPGQLKAGDTLIERMAEVSAKNPELKSLEVAAIVRRKYPADYEHLSNKTLVNRNGEAKRRFGMRLSAPVAGLRAAVGQQLRQQQTERKKTGSNIPSSYEKYLAAILRQLQTIKK